ncbi:hypothetical protein GCM10008955_17390 [Deinococcus malanensis]|uniref:HTH cro/C1-type domain-containing protein n=1 Tax=Deinococcus malanensis TaxID=1706855 RepID=A0ABQ2ESZ8_9DEIO|nr:helix-turn-helix transcriptional regulator [Deinococcus malanensis]GGK24343.1 hypothetical protein GCM10008955_17390 [Deinococcus malanensis]
MGRPTERTRSALGQCLEARRKELRLSGQDIERFSRGILSQRTVSRLEYGDITLRELRTAQRAALADVLGWTVEEFEAHTGHELGFGRLGTPGEPYDAFDPPPEVQGPFKAVAVPYCGELRQAFEPSRLPRQKIWLDKVLLPPEGRGDLFAFQLGETYVDERAKAELPRRGVLILEVGRTAREGELAVVRLCRQPGAVIVTHRGDVAHYVLNSSRPGARPVVLDAPLPPPAGVVVSAIALLTLPQ